MDDAPVTLRLLGGVELIGPGGEPARAVLAQPSRIALLIYLASGSPGILHRRETVRALFWPEADASHARQSLNRAVYFLRRALGHGLIETIGDEELAIAPARLHYDVRQFLESLRQGEADRALGLYRGDLAPGFTVDGLAEFEQWLERERVALRARAVAAATELADRDESNGALAAAERWVHRASQLLPYDERLVARQVELRDRLGDRAGALRLYDDFERRLRTELELVPCPQTVARIARVRDRKPPPPYSGEASSRAETELVAPAGPVTDALASAPARSPRRGRWPILVAASAIMLLAARLTWSSRPGPLLLTTARAVPLTSEPGIEFQPALSPDGSLVAYTVLGERRTYLTVRSAAVAPGGGGNQPAPSLTEDEMLPTWSPDGGRIRFRADHNSGELPASFTRGRNPAQVAWREVPWLGGPVQTIDLPPRARWPAWSRDGRRVAFVEGDSLVLRDGVVGQPRALLAVGPVGDAHSLTWSPDGKWLVYVRGNSFWPVGWNTAPSQIWLVESRTGHRSPVTASTHLNVSPAWLDAHHLLYVSDQDGQREIYAITIGPDGPTGSAVKVPGGTEAHSVSLSADGRRAAIARFSARQNVRSFPLNASRPLFAREGQAVTSGSQMVETHDISADGEWLAYDTDLHGQADIFKVPLAGGAPIPLVTGPDATFSPRWSPDGREVAFSGGETFDIWVVSSDGGPPTRLTDAPEYEELPVWSPDGLVLAYRRHDHGRIFAWILTRERVGGAWSRPRRLTDFECAYVAWMPDGSGLLCGEPKVPVVTLVEPTGRVRWRKDLGGRGLKHLGPPAISPDGRTLYLGAGRGREAGIWAVPLAGGPPRLVVTMEDPTQVVQAYPGTINVTRDRLYLTVGEGESDIWLMDLSRP